MSFICPPQYHIRPMRPDDLDAVLAIDKLSFPTPAKLDLLKYEITENKIAEYHCLLELETIVGYDGFWVVGDEIHISTIAVHPDWRGKGLGELLLQNSLYIAQANPITMVTLEVRENNHTAQALYKKYKFKEVGIRKRYYRDTNEDAILMTLSPLDAPYTNFLNGMNQTLVSRIQV